MDKLQHHTVLMAGTSVNKMEVASLTILSVTKLHSVLEEMMKMIVMPQVKYLNLGFLLHIMGY